MQRQIIDTICCICTILIYGVSDVTAQNNGSASAFKWQIEIFNPEADRQKIIAAFEKQWEGRDYQAGAGIKPFKRWEYYTGDRLDRNGKLALGAYREAYLNYLRDFSPQRSAMTGDWQFLGPFDVPVNNNGIGRINVIAFPPGDPNAIWIGAPSGGLWMSTDKGVTWETSTDQFPYLGVSDIAFHPHNPDTVFLATGDRDHSDAACFGLLKSTNGGSTWDGAGLESESRIHRILIHPTHPDTMLVAASSGIKRSNDGGQTWNVIKSGYFRHMEFKPGNPDVVYASIYGATGSFYRSTDGGNSFSMITLPAWANTPERIAIGVSPANANVVYLLGGYDHPSGANDFAGIMKSSNSGATFSLVTTTVAPSLGSQQWYDWAVGVHPNNANELYAGGVGFYKSTNGGQTWTNSLNGMHVDFHHITFHPVSGDLYAANDGGIFRSDNNGVSWENLSGGIHITQYYRIGTSDINPDLIFGGTQDNGTHRLLNDEWRHVNGGDGMETIADPVDPSIAYAEYQYGHVRKSTNGGNSFSTIFWTGTSGESAPWVTPYVLDPNDHNTIYIGHENIWKSDNGGSSFANISAGQMTGQHIRAVEVAPSTSQYIYVAELDSFYRSINGGITWQYKPGPYGMDYIAVDAGDPMHVFITAGTRIWESDDGGDNWVNISSGLPSIPVNCVAYQPGSPDGIYVGTDMGVFYRDSILNTWVPFNLQLPNVEILELEIDPCIDRIRAATFGRGIWESPLYQPSDNTVCCGNLALPVYQESNICGDPETVLRTVPMDAPGGYTLQWYQDGLPISGSNADTLLIIQNGNFNVQIRNESNLACHSLLSDTARIDLSKCITCTNFNPNTDDGPGNKTAFLISKLFPDTSLLHKVELRTLLRGDIGMNDETFNVEDENGISLFETTLGMDCQSEFHADTFSVAMATFNQWTVDDTITIRLDPTSDQIYPYLCVYNEGCVELTIQLKDLCSDTLYVSGVVSDNTNYMEDVIISDAMIMNNVNVSFDVHQSADLLSGFEATSGTIFQVNFGDCISEEVMDAYRRKREKSSRRDN